MKKRILSFALVLAMVISAFVIPTTVAATESENTIYSYKNFIDGDVRTIAADKGQVVDLGFIGEAATAPVVDGEIGDNEYIKSNIMYHHDTTSKFVTVNYAVHGDYLYVLVNTMRSGYDINTRTAVQYDIGIAASGSAEATWNRLGISVNAAGEVAASRSPFVHEYGGNGYSESLYAVRNADYLVDQTFNAGIYEAKFDLGQMYRLFANLPGGQKAWESPTVNFSFWMLGATSDHFDILATLNNGNGRTGDWVSTTVIIPEATLSALAAKYKGVIGPLGYDYRNAVAGQLVSIKDYATVVPTVDGVVNAADAYTTTGSWTTNKAATIGDIVCNFSVINGYLYGAFVCDGQFTGDPFAHFGTFAAVNSSSMRDSRAQTTIKKGGTWNGDNGGMWKTANGPSTAPKGNWENKELNSSTGAHQVWKNVATSYDTSANKTTVEFQINIPNLLAILQFEGFNTSEANAIQFMFWPVHAGATASIPVSAEIRDQYRATNGYGYSCNDVLPTVELPKGCSELYTVSDVDDMEAFGQRVVNAKPSTANVDGVIGSGEYTAYNYYGANDFTSYNANDKNLATDPSVFGDLTQTDYYAYDSDYFYYAAKIYDPYFVSGTSLIQMNLSVLNKTDSYKVVNTWTKADGKVVTVNTLRENYVDIADVITRASWDNKLNNDGVATNMDSKPGSVIRTQALTSAGLASDVQAAFKERANTFADAGYQFAGHYDEATQTYVFEAKIPLDELKNLFQLDDDYDINSINVYTLYKFNATGTSDYAVTYKVRDAKLNAAWEAVRTLTQASKGSKDTPYNQNCIPNVVKFVEDPYTKESASVRISTANSGLRFKSIFSNDYLAYMQAYAAANGKTMEVGTLIAPADYITGEFTHAALGAGRYVEVKADLATPFANANGITTIAGSIVNIKPGNLGRNFAGIGYIKIGNEYFYADNYTVKNVSDVATAAIGDTAKAQGNGYNYEISTGVWSPYSVGQREVLNALIAK